MNFKELNTIVRADIQNPDWHHYRGAILPKGCGYASDKTILVKEEEADPDIFSLLEKIETLGSKRDDSFDPDLFWDRLVSDYGVYEIAPKAFLNLEDNDEYLFNYMILLRDDSRDMNFFLDGRRYRILLEAVPIEGIHGKGRKDPMVTVRYVESEDNVRAIPTGVITPVSDPGKYIEKFREENPGLII